MRALLALRCAAFADGHLRAIEVGAGGTLAETDALVETGAQHQLHLQAEAALRALEQEAQRAQQRAAQRAEAALHLEDVARADGGVHTCSCVTPEDEERADLKHLRWLHFPKTGTSFWSTLYEYACREKGPLDLNVSPFLGSEEGSVGTSHPVTCSACYDFAVMERFPPGEYCAADAFQSLVHGGYCVTDEGCPETQHRGLYARHMASPVPDDAKHTVAMFREPRARLTSAAFNSHMAGFSQDEIEAVHQRCAPHGGMDAQCFADSPGIQGCMTRMLTGGACADGKASREKAGVTSDAYPVDVDKAVATMEELAFVGLTEEWNDSVCLFHKMFGGKVSQSEFKNFHKSSEHDGGLRADFQDAADGPLYAAAKARFAELQQQHGAAQCYALEAAPACTPRSCEDSGVECGATSDCAGPVDCGRCPQHRAGPADCAAGGKCVTSERTAAAGTFAPFSFHG